MVVFSRALCAVLTIGFAAAPAAPAMTADSITSSAAVHAAARVMVVLIRCSFRNRPLPSRNTAGVGARIQLLGDEVDPDRRLERTDRLAAAHQLTDGLATFLAV